MELHTVESITPYVARMRTEGGWIYEYADYGVFAPDPAPPTLTDEQCDRITRAVCDRPRTERYCFKDMRVAIRAALRGEGEQ